MQTTKTCRLPAIPAVLLSSMFFYASLPFVVSEAKVLRKSFDSYAACLIGKATVALDNQKGRKNADRAIDSANNQCRRPWSLKQDEGEIEGIDDYVREVIIKRADQESLNR